MMIRNSLVLGALLAAPSVAFQPASNLFSSSVALGMVSSPTEGDDGIPSFSLIPDQGKGTTMNPRYQIDKQSIYPPAMQQRRAASATEARKQLAGTTKNAGFSASADYMMWDGTSGMSRQAIDPESHYPAGMSFSRFSPSDSNPNKSLQASPDTPKSPSELQAPSSALASTSDDAAEGDDKPRMMTPEEKVAYTQALKSQAGKNHMMWDGTTGMSRQPINPSSSYPRGMRRGIW